MGQANKRGTFEQRRAEAIARNEKLSEQIDALPADDNTAKYLRASRAAIGMRRLSIALAMAGITEIKKPEIKQDEHYLPTLQLRS